MTTGNQRALEAARDTLRERTYASVAAVVAESQAAMELLVRAAASVRKAHYIVLDPSDQGEFYSFVELLDKNEEPLTDPEAEVEIEDDLSLACMCLYDNPDDWTVYAPLVNTDRHAQYPGRRQVDIRKTFAQLFVKTKETSHA